MCEDKSTEKYVTIAVSAVAITFILSSLTYFSIDEYFADKKLQVYIEKGCAKEAVVGTASLQWKCPDQGGEE